MGGRVEPSLSIVLLCWPLGTTVVFLAGSDAVGGKRLCGTPTLSLRVAAEAPLSRSADTFTVVAYLYDLPPQSRPSATHYSRVGAKGNSSGVGARPEDGTKGDGENVGTLLT